MGVAMPSRLLSFFKSQQSKVVGDGSIGTILVNLGFVTKDQLLDAITAKLKSDTEALIGEILIARGAVTRTQLDRALLIQREFRGNVPDYVGEIRNLVAGAHARAETVQARLVELESVAREVAKDPPKLLPLKRK